MKIVIAGGTGFLGRPLAEVYAEEGHDVRVLTRGLPPGETRHDPGTGVPGVIASSSTPDLHDVRAGAKPRHGEWWFGARPEREPRAGREVERKLGDRVEALIVLERFDMVEDEDDGLLHPGHRRGDARRDGGHRMTTVSRSKHLRSDRVDPVEGGGGVRHQPPQIIVVLVDREPREA